MDICVSVIVPIYNVKKYINRGIENLLAQTYENFEIILVDAGSTDGSLEICTDWASQDDRMLAVHQKNQGSGGAGNSGIEAARGKERELFDVDEEIDEKLLS